MEIRKFDFLLVSVRRRLALLRFISTLNVFFTKCHQNRESVIENIRPKKGYTPFLKVERCCGNELATLHFVFVTDTAASLFLF